MKRKGFVDLQVNGWMGVNFSEPDLTVDAVRLVTRGLLARGTLAYCPTITTAPWPVMRRNCAVLAAAMREPDLRGHLLGIHLEGPFLSPLPGASGAHPTACMRAPSIAAFTELLQEADGRIALLTLAPELPDALALIAYARQQGVVVGLGHHLADDETLRQAVDAGATVCTHLGNGIPNEIPRHQNPLWWQLAADRLWATFITDGHHLPDDFITVALRAKTPARFVVVSDASAIAGMPPGRYTFCGHPVEIRPDGLIWSAETHSLAGSHALLLECMNTLAALGILTEEELWQVGYANPLAVLGHAPEFLADVDGPTVSFDGQRFTVVPAAGHENRSYPWATRSM